MASAAFDRASGDGLSARERRILDLWDAGRSIEAIVRQLGLPLALVRDTVSLFHDGPSAEEVTMRAGLPAANARMVAAMLAAQAKAAAQRRRELIEVGEIENMLRDRAEAVVRELFPNARKAGHEMVLGSLAGEPGSSLSINVGGGPKRGMWKDFAGGDAARGDMLCLIEQALFGGDRKRAVQWAKSFLRIVDGDGPEVDRARIDAMRLEAQANAERRQKDEARQRQAIIASAQARWHSARRLERGDPVDEYLRGRGIDLAVLAEASGGRTPGAIRYHPALQYGVRVPGGPEPYVGPALVAMVTALSGAHIATHRIWLGQDARGRWGKAGPELLGRDERGEPNDPKKVLGSPRGGHIPLWKGSNRQPLHGLKPGEDVFASEGIENGLTAACADPSIRVISTVALPFLGALQLPEIMSTHEGGRLIWLRDNDPPGSDAEKLLREGVRQHREAGRRVGFVNPPDGAKDINDVAQAGLK